jgi:hypothetical protein
MKRRFASLLLFVFVAASLWSQVASANASSVPVPHLVKFTGTIAGTHTGNVGVIFALYKDQTGGAPLWQEVQSITVDASGHYTALLGARNAAGIPLDVFSSGEARWLGIQAEGQAEQARVLLVSVPYAMKAADAETLGGLPASAFLRADTVEQSTAYVNGTAIKNAAAAAVSAAVDASGATAGYVPVFTDTTGNLGNSLLAQSANGIGIGTANPLTTLHLLGTNPTMRMENYGPAGSGDSPNFNYYTANGSASAPTASLAGDNLGQFAATGFNGTAFGGSKVKVTFIATENWNATSNGTAVAFHTTTNGTTSRQERVRIDNTGYVGIGTPTPTSPLTVAGTIQSTSGGFKFPDGTIQTSASPVIVLPGGGETITGPSTTGVNALSVTTNAGGASAVVGTNTAGLGIGIAGVSGIGTNGTTGLYGTSDYGLGLYVANSSAQIDATLRVGQQVEMGNEVLGGSPDTNCSPAGATCTTPSVPYSGMVVRRVKSDDPTAGNVIAYAQIDNTDPLNPQGVSLQRDGSADGFALVTDPGLAAGIGISYSCVGFKSSGSYIYPASSYFQSGNTTSQQVYTSGNQLISFRCTFGRMVDGGNVTTVDLTRAYASSKIWIGTIISDTNQ